MVTIIKGSYVENISGCVIILKQLNHITSQLNNTSLWACRLLDKLKSNHLKFLVPCLSSQDVLSVPSFEDLTSEILRISYHSHEDIFLCQNNISFNPAITKRTILSEAAQLFDPLGLILLVVTILGTLMQQLWLEKIDSCCSSTKSRQTYTKDSEF